MSSTSSIDSGSSCSNSVFSAGTTSSSSPSPSPSPSLSSSFSFSFSFSSELSFRIISGSDFEFEFDFPDTELPLSPKIICPNSSPAPYNWSPASPQQPVTTLRNLHQPVTVPPSVRHLMAHENGHDDFDFYTAPSTPRPAAVTTRGSSAHLEFGIPPAEILKNYYGETSEACPAPQEAEEERKGKKSSRQSSGKKWAFKDLLRRTVPSSKFDSPARTSLSRGDSGRSESAQTVSPKVRRSASSPTTPPPMSPATPRHAPRGPRAAPLAAHLQYQKSQSPDIRRKTYLPYRQSLFGCLGGGVFVAEKAW